MSKVTLISLFATSSERYRENGKLLQQVKLLCLPIYYSYMILYVDSLANHPVNETHRNCRNWSNSKRFSHC